MSRWHCLVLSPLLFAAAYGFEVLDVGAPRTGTQSMYDMMRILGYNPIHSGYMWDTRKIWCNYLFGNGTLDAALATLQGYDAAMDEPFQLVYEEIMAAFPKVKFLLTMPEPEAWYESYLKIIDASPPDALDFHGNDVMSNCTAVKYWGCDFYNRTAESKEKCMKAYVAHNERIKEVVPPDRLLIYDFADSWTSLAHFLGKPIPDQPIPHTDWAVVGMALQSAAQAARDFMTDLLSPSSTASVTG